MLTLVRILFIGSSRVFDVTTKLDAQAIGDCAEYELLLSQPCACYTSEAIP